MDSYSNDDSSQLGDEIVSTLQSMGFDLQTTHEFQYYFYFPLKDSAEKLAMFLSDKGFTCSVGEAAGGTNGESSESVCLAKHRVNVDGPTLSSLGIEFKRAAEELGGVFDGWERVPQPNEPLPPMVAMMGGFQIYQEGRYEEAIELFTSLLESGSEVEDQILPILGLAYLKLGQLEHAVGPFEKMITLEPDCIEHKLNIGVAYHGLGKYDKALSYFKEALALDPSHPSIHYNLACANARQGSDEDALSALAKAIDGNPAFREQAAVDSDFETLKNLTQFKALL